MHDDNIDVKALNQKIKIGEPVFLRNLLLFPLTNGNGKIENVTSIDHLLEKKLCEIEELHPPRIDGIRVRNRSDQHLLLIDGEEVLGAMQNRITAASYLVETQSDLVVPTVCVEEGRWESKDANRFFSGRSVSYPTLRAILARNTIRGNRATDLKKSQRLIWQEIERKLSITRINSQTSSMHDLYDGLNDEISHYLEDIKGIEDICGVIAVVANKFLALDLFGSNELFKIFKEKLIKSYVLDALEHRDRVTSIPEGLPAKLVQELTEAKMVRLRSRGLGFEYRLEARRLLGRALVSQPKSRIGTRLLHLSLFPVN